MEFNRVAIHPLFPDFKKLSCKNVSSGSDRYRQLLSLEKIAAMRRQSDTPVVSR